jgi:hypothetical protein
MVSFEEGLAHRENFAEGIHLLRWEIVGSIGVF